MVGLVTGMFPKRCQTEKLSFDGRCWFGTPGGRNVTIESRTFVAVVVF